MRTNYDDPVFSEKLRNCIQLLCSRSAARITNQPTAPYEKALHWRGHECSLYVDDSLENLNRIERKHTIKEYARCGHVGLRLATWNNDKIEQRFRIGNIPNFRSFQRTSSTVTRMPLPFGS